MGTQEMSKENPQNECFGVSVERLNGRGCGARTHDPLIKSQLLYQLS